MTLPNDADRVTFPPMCDAVLDRATVIQLFADLAGCTEVLEVQHKGGARAYAATEAMPLTEARDRLLAAELRAVQVRYRHDGHEWIDTLLTTPGGIRCVRTRCT